MWPIDSMLVGRDALDRNSVFSSILGLFGLIGKLLPLVVFPGVAVPDRGLYLFIVGLLVSGKAGDFS